MVTSSIQHTRKSNTLIIYIRDAIIMCQALTTHRLDFLLYMMSTIQNSSLFWITIPWKIFQIQYTRSYNTYWHYVVIQIGIGQIDGDSTRLCKMNKGQICATSHRLIKCQHVNWTTLRNRYHVHLQSRSPTLTNDSFVNRQANPDKYTIMKMANKSSRLRVH